ncbi:NUDIX domain-containing protein [Ditylenchus destructor]|nr:NUDIX domain-containing protein [Ditylenchus destructor]
MESDGIEQIDGNVLVGELDVYNGLTILPQNYVHVKEENAKEVLRRSIEFWIQKGYNGIWFRVDIQESWWIPVLVKHGFIFHHAQPSHVMLTKWIPANAINTLPRYPFTSIGAGGLVVNSKNEVLLIRELRGPYLGWKFPGGSADPGENIGEAAAREVFEETGVKCSFQCILAFRHAVKFHFENTADIYFLCVMNLDDESSQNLKPCPREVAACEWMSRDQIEKLPEKQFHRFNRKALKRYDEWKASGRKGCYNTSLDMVNQAGEVIKMSGFYLFD